MSRDIYIVESKDEALELEASAFALSTFSDVPNIGTKELEALLSGKALVDLSDGEYIHWIQLTPDAIKTAKLQQ